MKTRLYDSELGRFISKDQAVGGGTALDFNPYLYCNNNPVSRIDPSGKSWWSVIAGLAVGAVVATVAYLCSIPVAIAVVVGSALGSLAGAVVGGYNYYKKNKGKTTFGGYAKAVTQGASSGAVGGAVGAAAVAASIAFVASLIGKPLPPPPTTTSTGKVAGTAVEEVVSKVTQDHHVIPKYIGGPATSSQGAIFQRLSVPAHQDITNAFRSQVPYGSQRAINLRIMSVVDPVGWKIEVDNIANQVYSQHPVDSWPFR